MKTEFPKPEASNLVDFPNDAMLDRLKSGGGDGTFGGMEARVARLESKMDKVEERLTSIEVLLARIDAKLDSKIDYKWMMVWGFGILAAILKDEIISFFTSAPTL